MFLWRHHFSYCHWKNRNDVLIKRDHFDTCLMFFLQWKCYLNACGSGSRSKSQKIVQFSQCHCREWPVFVKRFLFVKYCNVVNWTCYILSIRLTNTNLKNISFWHRIAEDAFDLQGVPRIHALTLSLSRQLVLLKIAGFWSHRDLDLGLSETRISPSRRIKQCRDQFSSCCSVGGVSYLLVCFEQYVFVRDWASYNSYTDGLVPATFIAHVRCVVLL